MSNDWTAYENQILAREYIAALKMALQGNRLAPKDYLRGLGAQLEGRSRGSIEFKSQNISSVMQQLGYPYLIGYKPLPHIQKALVPAVERELLLNPIEQLVSREALKAISEQPVELKEVDAPSLQPLGNVRQRRGQKVDYASLEASNRSLGLAGELAVVAHVRATLSKQGRDDLAERVEHVSVTQGDGLGYDILGFEADGSPVHIEVKTTQLDGNWPFLVTASEVAASKELAQSFRLYRVHSWGKSTGARFYVLRGNLEESCFLTPKTFSAGPT
ncbi:DUF3883 domain-containing protein [Corynebacterium doosanense]|uniref:DUF3883 domain-containing protein n=1 Tax=Corynebacterium doosanense TaxID=1121358 RepID=UPI0009D91FE6|nr:DUF3883 domain-containing protein [Corynebacterium doosanense]